MIHITLSGDIFLKSRRTQPRMIKRVLASLQLALDEAGCDAPLERLGSHRFAIDAGDRTDAVIERATRIFGVASVNEMEEIAAGDLDHLASEVARLTRDRVVGRTFGVRVKRRGTHTWKSYDLASRSGSLLVEAGGTVNLDDPQEPVDVIVMDDRAFLVVAHHRGPGGLPVGTQEPVLGLISGGFDSVVAAWMMMSRGCPVEFVHFTLSCSQSDHAVAVARALWERWGYGTDPIVHVVEFQPVKEALLEHVDVRMRQVALKVLMARAASRIAEEQGILALLTGDAMGQVSSQTLPHLVAVSDAADVPIFRPLLGLPKQDIIDYARRIGTAEMSARAQEVCDLSGGRPVATGARPEKVARSLKDVPESLMTDAVATRKVFLLRDWFPGAM
ncbi:MAG: THUMP domain-containing protein [Actinomycetota bacterium]|nr:THUMP domain-containing protein [Actinomycetota bacterium]